MKEVGHELRECDGFGLTRSIVGQQVPGPPAQHRLR
jgi:hypothetical protein